MAGVGKVEKVMKLVKEKVTKICNSKDVRRRCLENPETDFTRDRKFTFFSLVMFRLLRIHDSNNKDLMSYFGIGKDRPSSSAYLKRLNKIKSNLWEMLFRDITDALSYEIGLSLFMGKYILAGCDGSDIAIYHNPEDHRCHHMKKEGLKHTSLVHLNALVALQDGVCLDYIIQPYREGNEIVALIEILKRMPDDLRKKIIVVADRGYESYNLIAWFLRLGIHFVIRIKDDESKGGMARHLFRDHGHGRNDFRVSLKITKSQHNAVAADVSFKTLNKIKRFDFLDDENGCYREYKYGNGVLVRFHEISFRLVKFCIGETDEVLVTDLDESEFPSKVLKEFYLLRWNEEGTIRHLKYDADAIKTHATSSARAIDEIVLALLMMNITSFMCIIAQAVLDEKIRKKAKTSKYNYIISFVAAIDACRIAFSLRSREGPKTLLDELLRSLSPVRPDRSYPRNKRSQGFRHFMYR